MIGKSNAAPKAAAAAPASRDSASSSAAGQAKGKGTQPTHVLKYKDENGKFVTVTNLFTNTTKDGSEQYLKGKDRNTNVEYFIMSKKEFEQK